MESKIDQKVFSSQISKSPNQKSLELGIVVKRVVIVFIIWFCSFVLAHLLFSNVIVHLCFLLFQKSVRLTALRGSCIPECPTKDISTGKAFVYIELKALFV